MISVEQALAFMLERARRLTETETVNLAEALGRVLATSQVSPIDVPGYSNSSMDGYAVRSTDLQAPGRHRLTVAQRIAAGSRSQGARLQPGEAARIFTGAPLPEPADAVVIQERCTRDGTAILIDGPVPGGANVRPRANDIGAGSEILASGVRLRPQEMGLLASVGLAAVPVFRRLRVAIFSTGNELKAPGEALPPGAIYNSNRYTLIGLLAGLGCETIDLGTIADTLSDTRSALDDAASRADLVVSTGGVSEGEEDHVKRALEQAGRLEMWKVAVKPGKPLAYGRIGEADFIGLPGNPVSTLVGFCLFVRPFILTRQGLNAVHPRGSTVRAAFTWSRPGDRREFLRARLVQASSAGAAADPTADIHPKQGSDVLTSTVWADGLVDIPQGRVVQPGDLVTYYPFTELLD